jgi:hypothetical protein
VLANVLYISLADFFSKQLIALTNDLEGLSTAIWMSQDQTLAEETQNLTAMLQTNLEIVVQMVGGRWWELEQRWRRRARRYDFIRAVNDLNSEGTQGRPWDPFRR